MEKSFIIKNCIVFYVFIKKSHIQAHEYLIYLGCVYKLVEVDNVARIKLSQDVEKVKTTNFLK